MKISFTSASEDRQDARKLRVLLQRLLANETDADNRAIVQSLLHNIDQFLAAPASETGTPVTGKDDSESDSFSPFDALFSFWHFLIVPAAARLRWANSGRNTRKIPHSKHWQNWPI